MASTRLRRGFWIGGIAAVLVAAGVALLPMIASTRIVRDHIAQDLSTLVGYRVSFAGGPNLTIWPTMTARLRDVSFHAWNASPDTPPVFQAEDITLDLSAVAALRGAIEFSNAKVARPVLRVTPSGRLALPPAPTMPGRVGYAVSAARRSIDANASAPDLSDLPSDPLGVLEFSDGRVVVVENGRDRDLITGASGRLEWLALNRPAIASFSGIWRGEQVSLSFTAPQPLVLLASGQSSLAVKFRSPPLQASFDGQVSAADDGFADGKMTLSSPSLRRFLEWSQSPMSIGAANAKIEVSTDVSGTRQRLKFEDTELTIDANRGVGALELTLTEPVPRVAGTLAFGGGLDLGAFLSAFTPFRAADPGKNDGAEVAISRHVDLDLRISAQQATAGSITLENVAATAQVKDRLAVLDVSDASAFGGTVQAGVRVVRNWDTNEAEIKLLATDVDAAAASAALGFGTSVPRAKGQMSLTLKGNGRNWNSVFETANGTVSAKLGKGTFVGFDLAAFLARVSEGRFFALSEVGKGELPIDNAEVKVTVRSGVAVIDKADIRTGNRMIRLGGIVPYMGRGLALSGSVDEVAQQNQDGTQSASPAVTAPEASPAQFFIGGTWASPYVSPVTSAWPPE